MTGFSIALLFISAAAIAAPPPTDVPFSQPFGNTAHWSVRGGLTLALHGVGVPGDAFGAPRGLLRIMLPLRPEYKVLRSLDFIAVEPSTLEGYRDSSELQKSPSDVQPGINFWFHKAEKAAGPCQRAQDLLDDQQSHLGEKAIENFELNAAFHPGHVYSFGVKPPVSLNYSRLAWIGNTVRWRNV